MVQLINIIALGSQHTPYVESTLQCVGGMVFTTHKTDLQLLQRRCDELSLRDFFSFQPVTNTKQPATR